MIFEDFQFRIVILSFFWVFLIVTPLPFSLIDMGSGLRKARKRGDIIRSNKLRRTVEKLAQYYLLVLAMVIVDAIQIGAFIILHLFNDFTLLTFPVFTFVAVVGIALIEVKSILEPADAKESKELKDIGKLAKAIVDSRTNPEELAKAIGQYLQTNENSNEG